MTAKSISEITEDVLAFLCEKFALTEHHTICHVDLRYAPVHQRPESIDALGPNEHPELFSTHAHAHVTELATRFVQRAVRYAESYGQAVPHRFEICATEQLGRTHKEPFLIFPSIDMARGGPLGGGAGALTLGGSGGGAMQLDGGGAAGGGLPALLASGGGANAAITGMLLQHIENHHKNTGALLAQFGSMLGTQAAALREENAELRADNRAMLKQRQEDLSILEQARNEDHKRQIEALTATSAEERKTLATKKVVALLPVAVSILGRRMKQKAEAAGVKPGKRAPLSPMAILIAKLFQSFSDGQISVLQTALSVEQQIVLGEIREVIESGDGEQMALIPTMLYDMADSLTAEQQGAIFGALNEEQKRLFLQAVMMAKASQGAAESTASAAQGAAEAAAPSSSNTSASSSPTPGGS